MSQQTLKLSAAGDSQTGPKKWIDLQTHQKISFNNDSLWVSGPLGLFLLCDGVVDQSGKNVGGYAALSIVDFFKSREGELSQAKKGTPAEIEQCLVQMIRSASLELSQNASKQHWTGFFSTLAVIWFVKQRAIVANVGNTPIYHLSQGRCSKDYKPHQDSNGSLTQCIGAPFLLDVFSTQLLLSPGDRFLLCSDGLLMSYNEAKIESLMKGATNAHSLNQQILKDISGQLQDDTSWIAVEIDPSAEIESTQGVSPHQQLNTLRQCEFFKILEDVEIQQISSIAEVVHVEKSHLFIREGEKGEDLFVLIEGDYAPVKKQGETWKASSVNKPGKLIGESALIGAKRSISCAAVTDVKALKIPAERLRELLSKDRHGLAYKVLFQALKGAIEYRSPSTPQ